MSVDNDVLIIGAGMSGVGFAVQLQKKFPGATYEIIEKADGIGGTWWVNTYPGCGCDVASHFYSYSFDLNPNWSQKYASQTEIEQYFRSVAERNNVVGQISFRSAVQKAKYDDSTATWQVTIQDIESGEIRVRRCRVLISAVGGLSTPKSCDIKGADQFEGPLFHSARWDHGFDYTNKDVVVVGNGCSATQFVPVISADPGVRKVTQFSRQAHWLAERPNPTYSIPFKLTMRYVPLAMRLYRTYHAAMMEKDFAGFNIEKGGKIREGLMKEQSAYIRKMAPSKYHDALIPKTVIGCKRKVMDTDYLQCLHRSNVELIYDDPIAEITPTGVLTKSGREVSADAIILATGFATQKMFFPLEIYGRQGQSLQDHWDNVSQGSPQAYYGTMMCEFPNFMTMMGANTTTGHYSTIYSIECQINFVLRLLRPILSPSRSLLYSTRSLPDNVMVKAKAEEDDNAWIQRKAHELVWATGCTNWYVDEETGRNYMLYPDWQIKFWLRSIFYPKDDFLYSTSKEGEQRAAKMAGQSGGLAWSSLLVSGTAVAAVVGIVALQSRHGKPNALHGVQAVLKGWISSVKA